jgi:hypothetical protein
MYTHTSKDDSILNSVIKMCAMHTISPEQAKEVLDRNEIYLDLEYIKKKAKVAEEAMQAFTEDMDILSLI